MTVKGIDVSSYQAATWATSGLAFVFAKATEGHSIVDAKQAQHAARARAAGLVFGQYCFMWPGDVQAQAQWFVDKSVTNERDLMAVDWETTSSGTMASNADKDALIKAIKALRPGHKVGLYTNTNSWLNVDKTGYYGDFLWIAEYGVPAGKPGITTPWSFHQYTSTPIDTNVGNFTSKAALQQWAGGTEPPVAHDALTAADVKTILTTDSIIPAPSGPAAQPDAKTNPYYTWQTHVSLQTQNAIEANLNTQALLKQVGALSATGLTDAQVQQIATAVGSNTALVSAIAEAVAEKLAARLQS